MKIMNLHLLAFVVVCSVLIPEITAAPQFRYRPRWRYDEIELYYNSPSQPRTDAFDPLKINQNYGQRIEPAYSRAETAESEENNLDNEIVADVRPAYDQVDSYVFSPSIRDSSRPSEVDTKEVDAPVENDFVVDILQDPHASAKTVDESAPHDVVLTADVGEHDADEVEKLEVNTEESSQQSIEETTINADAVFAFDVNSVVNDEAEATTVFAAVQDAVEISRGSVIEVSPKVASAAEDGSGDADGSGAVAHDAAEDSTVVQFEEIEAAAVKSSDAVNAIEPANEAGLEKAALVIFDASGDGSGSIAEDAILDSSFAIFNEHEDEHIGEDALTGRVEVAEIKYGRNAVPNTESSDVEAVTESAVVEKSQDFVPVSFIEDFISFKTKVL